MRRITYPDGRPITYVVNVGDLPWMPDDSPFGNLNPKLFWVMTLLAHANRRLEEAAEHWSAAVAGSFGHDIVEHKMASSEGVFAMRRAADELVTLVAVLDERLATGVYASKPKFDSVGTAFDKNGEPKMELWRAHAWALRTLNDLANAHKHSFVDSDTTVIGQQRPCATALLLAHNDLDKNQAKLYVVALDDIATAFASFLADVLVHLRSLTDALRNER